MNLLRLIFLLICSAQIAVATPAETFAAANAAYNAKNFGEAITSYETLLRRGETRPEIYYNLGLAYEKSANPAHAVLSFERTLLLAPGYEDTQARLDALSGGPSHWWEQLPRFGTHMSVIAAICAFWIFLLALAARWRGLGNSKHLWTVAAVLCVIVFSIAATSFYLRDLPFSSPDRAIVVRNEKLRANFTASAPTILSLRPGQAVQITSVNGPWTECRLPDQTTGWVATASLERVIPQS